MVSFSKKDDNMMDDNAAVDIAFPEERKGE